MKKLLLTAAAIMMLSTPAIAEEFTVKMITNLDAEQMYYFEPAELTIQPGDTVKWVMVQEGEHNAVADAGPKGAELFTSQMMEKEGESWSYTFGETEGTYSYHCHPHSAMGMKGVIIVGKPSTVEEMEGAAGHGDHDHGSSKEMPMKMKHGDTKHDHGSMKAEPIKEGKKVLYWVAPMDKDFRRDKPGKSPMGMDLVPVYEAKEELKKKEPKKENHGNDHAH